MRLVLALPLLLAACSEPLTGGVNLSGGGDGINEIGLTATQGGEITISGEARTGVSGRF